MPLSKLSTASLLLLSGAAEWQNVEDSSCCGKLPVEDVCKSVKQDVAGRVNVPRGKESRQCIRAFKFMLKSI